MIRLPGRYAALCLVLLILMRTGASAAEYEVGPGKTYGTLESVTRLLKPGDVVTVEGGVTYPGGVSLDANGAQGPGVISIIGRRVNGSRPILSGVTAQGGTVLRVRGSHYLISGFEMTAGADSRATRCFYNVGDDVVLRDSIVHDCHFTGIAGSDASGSLTLNHVEVYRCGVGLYAHQIYVGSSLAKYPHAVFRMQFCYVHDGAGGNNVKSRVTRNMIEYNWIEGAGYHELDLVGPDPKAQQTPPGDFHCDADIIGNVLINTKASQGTIARFGTDATASSNGRYRLINNTVIVENPGTAKFGLLWLQGQVDSLLLYNNVFWSENEPMSLLHPGGDLPPILLGDGNWIPAAAIDVPAEVKVIRSENPGFTNASAGNYRPSLNSPLINSGVNPPSGIRVWSIPPNPANPEPSIVLRPAARTKDIGAYPFVTPAG